MKSTFKVIFYLKKRQLRAGEKVASVKFPIMGRITVNGLQAAITCKLFLNPSAWDVTANRARGKSEEAQEVNRVLNNISAKITKVYQDLCVTETVITAAKVKSVYEGIDKEYKTLLESYQNYLDDFAKRVGKDRKPHTLENIKDYFRILKSYMRDKLEIDDITFRELTPEFMKGFISYMRNDMHYSTSYMADAVRKCRRIVHKAKDMGIIQQDPFRGYWIDHKHKDRVPLEESDIKKLMNVELKYYRARAVRDIYLFMIFTGLSYCDVEKLEYDNLQTTDEGDMWIIDKRLKNDASFKVKLVPHAKELVERYRNFPGKKNENRVFPVKGYDGMYGTLRRIAARAGVKTTCSLHVGRHTFATTITLEQGVPLETVSKMLGHRKITTTQIYSKVLKNKISHDMDAISAHLTDKYQLPEPNMKRVV